MILELAEIYGQLPETIEQQDEYWLNRAIKKLQGEAAYSRRKASRKK